MQIWTENHSVCYDRESCVQLKHCFGWSLLLTSLSWAKTFLWHCSSDLCQNKRMRVYTQSRWNKENTLQYSKNSVTDFHWMCMLIVHLCFVWSKLLSFKRGFCSYLASCCCDVCLLSYRCMFMFEISDMSPFIRHSDSCFQCFCTNTHLCGERITHVLVSSDIT